METNIENKNLLKTIVMDLERKAKFDHAVAGVLYYTVEGDFGKYIFPVDMNDKEDVGTASFDAEIKAITMMRYIRKAILNNSLIKLK